MRKIDKTNCLSTAYKKWADSLADKHPRYTSSNGKYYLDIAMALLHCQQGLCAYTEVQLCDKKYFDASLWKDGSYIGSGKEITMMKNNFAKQQNENGEADLSVSKVFNGQLEHFNEQLKFKENNPDSLKQDWLWDNLFMVEADTNNHKGTKPVDNILKPDTEEYDPFELLEYSDETHQYIPHPKFKEDDPEKRQRIATMIETLGLNFPNLVSKRLVIISKAIELGVRVIEPEFPTAFQFVERKR